jgi:hypothetical protein
MTFADFDIHTARLADLAEVQSLVDRARPISLADWTTSEPTLLGGWNIEAPDYADIYVEVTS